jgi:hypothetical protein
MRWILFGAAVLAVSGLLVSAEQTELSQPLLLKVDGEPIDVEIGHAAPFLGDIDGDELPDLLVGQFGEGQLRVYKNIGTASNPIFAQFTWFEAGGKLGSVPSG